MNKQLSPLEALRQIRVCHNLECGVDKSMNERLDIIETALKDYETLQKNYENEKKLNNELTRYHYQTKKFLEMLDNVINEYCFKEEQFTIEEFD